MASAEVEGQLAEYIEKEIAYDRMISNTDHTIRRRSSGDPVAHGRDVLRQLWRLEIPVRELIPGDSSAATNGT